MVSTSSSVASLLSDIYTNTSANIAASMTKLATGKRVSNPGDDFAAYVKAATLDSDVTAYQTIKQNLQGAQGMVNYAQGVGNNVAADLTKLKDLFTQYGATSDADQKSSIKAQYDALVSQINNESTNAYYDNTQVYKAASLKSVKTDSSGTGTLDVTTSAIGDASAVNDITTATAGGIQNEINNAQTFVAEMSSYSTQISRAITLSNTAISGKQATISALTDVDQATELTKLTNLQVQQQAAVSMMSQANSLQAGIARLFQ